MTSQSNDQEPATNFGCTQPGAAGHHSISSLAREAMAKVVAKSREQQVPRVDSDQIPEPHVIAMAKALADANHALAEDLVANLLEAGLSVQDLCKDHLAPAARALGMWWMQDKMAFTDVTLGAARIQSILRRIPVACTRTFLGNGPNALFVAVPGETHTLGVIMAADHFRRLGWDVSLLIGMDHADLCNRIAQDDRKVVVMSCAGRHSISALRRLADEVRWQRPDMKLLVSGLIALDDTALTALPEFDAVIPNLETAEAVMTAVSETSNDMQMEEIRARA